MARHSGASRALLALRLEGDWLTATVSDDGAGFVVGRSHDIGPDRPAHEVGLEGMRERAELIGAELNIDSEPGRGTVIRVSVAVGQG